MVTDLIACIGISLGIILVCGIFLALDRPCAVAATRRAIMRDRRGRIADIAPALGRATELP